MRLVTSLVLLFAGVIIGDASAQRPPDLDLSQVSRPPSTEGRGPARGGIIVGESGGIRGGTFSGEVRSVPIAVRLLSIEPQDCSWLDRITYDVELRNVSDREILLPWSLDRRHVGERSDEANIFPRATISLHINRPFAVVGTVEVLYGSQQAPATTRVVAPGEAVVVRGVSRCQINDPELARSVGKGESLSVQVATNVHLQRDPAYAGVTARSSNTVTLAISRP